MARKKNSKRMKHQAEKSAPHAILIKKMEKSLQQTPAKLAKLVNKEITSIKKKQNKLKSTIDKINIKIKKQEKRVFATNNKLTPTGKKQAKAAQKKLNETLKIQHHLNQQWEKTSLPLEQITKQQAKYIALNKHLDAFEKDWIKQEKETQKANKQSKKIIKQRDEQVEHASPDKKIKETESNDSFHDLPTEVETADLTS